MDTIKRLFPHAMKACDVTGLLVALAIYVLVNLIGGFVLGLFAKLPLIGFAFGFAGWILGMYCAVGVIVSLLLFFHIIK